MKCLYGLIHLSIQDDKTQYKDLIENTGYEDFTR